MTGPERNGAVAKAALGIAQIVLATASGLALYLLDDLSDRLHIVEMELVGRVTANTVKLESLKADVTDMRSDVEFLERQVRHDVEPRTK